VKISVRLSADAGCFLVVEADSEMVCTRVPHPSRSGRRQTKAWSVDATTNALIELGEHLVSLGIEKVTLESRITGGRSSTCWRRRG
jgi:hypothetical protein